MLSRPNLAGIALCGLAGRESMALGPVMPELFTCLQGHQWQPPTPMSSSAMDSPVACPVCGAPLAAQISSTVLGKMTGTLSLGQMPPMPEALQGPTLPFSSSPGEELTPELPTVPGYEILGVLGRGGMGIVYKARQINLNRLVALKMILAGVHAGPQLLARFHFEAEAVASLQHPNIVQIHEVSAHDGCPYFSLEFMDGGSLAEKVGGRPQPPRAAAELVETLARAMYCAHQRGVIHRDLKPANILLTAEGVAKITDFGLAKRLEDASQTQTGAILGTPSYMAPEQAAGDTRQIGPATDVYALGAVLYGLLTGQPPFRAKTTMETLQAVQSQEPPPLARWRVKVPRDLEVICFKCLEKEPRQRYASAEALADDLHRFLTGEPIRGRSVGAWERAAKWVRRRPALAALIGVSVAAAGALSVGGISWSVQVRTERDRVRSSLRVARQAIDDLYTKMASERLFDEPQLDPLCQELLEKARILYERLALEHGDDADVRRNRALNWFRLGEIHRLLDQYSEAENAYIAAIAEQEQLRGDNPHEPCYQEDLANSHNWLGELLREAGRPADEAEQHYRAALELQKELVGQHPTVPAYRTEEARSHYNLGIIQTNTNRLTEARADYDRAVDLLTELYRTDAQEPNVRQDLARALINRGVLHRLSRRLDDAVRDYNQAIHQLGRLRENFPARAAYKFELAIARQDRGNLFWSQGRHAEAQHEHRQALDLLRGLVADFSSRPRYQKKMGNALKNLGAALASAGDSAGAECCWEQARTLFAALARDYPQKADYNGLLGMTLGNLGWLRTEKKDWPEARRLLEQGIAQMQKALRPNPLHPDYRQELRDRYQDLAETLVQLGDHAAAVRAARNLANVFPECAQGSYYAACFISRCATLARQDNKTARSYVEQAVVLLRAAAGGASSNLKRLPDEKQVFQPLAMHPELSAVMSELEAKVPSPRE
jgi:serine/threonine-protein kinase